MPQINKPIDDIREIDLQALISNVVEEDKTIEYKQIMPGNSDSDRKEFLADISSFANCIGGDIIYGIKEENGKPIEICGLQNINSDIEKRRLYDIIQVGISPRIQNINIHSIDISTGVVIIVRIARSWLAPHMITYKIKDSERFFSRGPAGKVALDISQIRSAFLLSDTIAERIRNFRRERLGLIINDETPVMLPAGAKLVLHIIPLNAFELSTQFIISQAEERSKYLKPIESGTISLRYNFDGFLIYDQYRGKNISYVQLFRSGIIESVKSIEYNQKRISSDAFKKPILEATKHYLSFCKESIIAPPISIMVALLNVAGYKMSDEIKWSTMYNNPIEKENLIIPEILYENYDVNIEQAMQPIFEIIWNSCGFPKSMR